MTFLRILALSALLLFAGCATYPKPDPSLIRWDQPYAWLDANLHADSIMGAAYRATGASMEPFIVEGDYEVADFAFKWENLAGGMIVAYDPNWADASIPLASHMLVERTGDGWIVTGINNRYSESGVRALMFEDYRAKVVQVYTARKKP